MRTGSSTPPKSSSNATSAPDPAQGCPGVPELVCAAAQGDLEVAVAAHLATCPLCGAWVKSLLDQLGSVDPRARLYDCDEAEVMLAELDLGLSDPAVLAPLVVHARECPYCRDELAGHLDPDAELASGPMFAEDGDSSTDPAATAHSFHGGGRFEDPKLVGSGGMGVVYEAFDRKLRAPVALKTFYNLSAQALYSLKNEFRSRQDLMHPNLVSLYELIEESGQWFFTMELVHGIDFIRYVCSSGFDTTAKLAVPEWNTQSSVDVPAQRMGQEQAGSAPWPARARAAPPAGQAYGTCSSFDPDRLRDALRQLCMALGALHRAGKVHRDIKPSNILITGMGRLVLLDFGLVADFSAPESTYNDAVGTPAYMAPEQATGQPVGPAADLYGLGVLLYQALTGELPFSGTRFELFLNKRWRKPPPPSELVPGVPADLDDLCMKLLSFDPAERPTLAAVHSCLQGEDSGMLALVAASGSGPVMQSIGRDAELEALKSHLLETRGPAQVTVLVSGEAGIGKSALLKSFGAWVRQSEHKGVVLAGRCYERELVKYKAVDKVVDALSRYLRKLRPREVAELMPHRAGLLGQIFPVLGRVEAIAKAPGAGHRELAPWEVRRRAFKALRDLLARIADRVPLVLLIDDFHWADADSLALLGELLRPPEPPALLLIATVHERERADELVAELPDVIHRLDLMPLADDAATELAASLLIGTGQDTERAGELARAADGHPLFIHELVRYQLICDPAGAAATPTPTINIEQALWARIDALEPAARHLLELIALAAAPLSQNLLGRAAGIGEPALARHLEELRSTHMVRAASATDALEPYHERVSRAVLGRLDEAARCRYHECLALALEDAGERGEEHDPELLAVHWTGAGYPARASQYALRAADIAATVLAFDRAAHHYSWALELMPPAATDHDEGERHELQVKLADALVNGGQSIEAAALFRQIAEGASPAEAVEYWLRVAESLLAAGQSEQGLQVIAEACDAVGLRLPRTERRALFALLGARGFLAVRGLRFRERAVGEITPRELMRVDLCWSAGAALTMLNSTRAAELKSRYVVLALRCGEPARVARALAYEALRQSLLGKSRSRVRATFAAARTLAARADAPDVCGFAAATSSVDRLICGDWRGACEHAAEAETHFQGQQRGMFYERGMARIATARALFYWGELRRLCDELPQWISDADEYSGRFWYAKTSFLTGLPNLVWLVAGDVEGAERARTAAMRTCATMQGIHIQHQEDLIARHHIYLYQRDGRGAWRDIEEHLPALARARLLGLNMIRLECLHARARSALAAATSVDTDLLRLCRTVARRIARERLPWAAPLAALLLAGVAAMHGDDRAAVIKLRAAVHGFDSAEMKLYAAVARRALGGMLGGDGGRELVAAVDRWMTQQRIADPARFAAMLAPGLVL